MRHPVVGISSDGIFQGGRGGNGVSAMQSHATEESQCLHIAGISSDRLDQMVLRSREIFFEEVQIAQQEIDIGTVRRHLRSVFKLLLRFF